MSTPKFNAFLEKLVAHLYYFIVTRYLSCLKRQLGFSSKNHAKMASRVTVSDPFSHFSIALNFLVFTKKLVGAQAPARPGSPNESLFEGYTDKHMHIDLSQSTPCFIF